MFKVETIEQYKVLQFLKEQFDLSFIRLTLINRFCIQVTDQNNDSAIFKFNEDTEEIDVDYDVEYIKF